MGDRAIADGVGVEGDGEPEEEGPEEGLAVRPMGYESIALFPVELGCRTPSAGPVEIGESHPSRKKRDKDGASCFWADEGSRSWTVPRTACDGDEFAAALGGYVHFGALEEVDEGCPGAVPAGMGVGGCRGGAEFDSFGGVGAALEFEPVAEGDGVVEEPACRGEGQDRGRRGGSACSKQAVAAVEAEGHGDPGEAGEDPAIVAGVDGGYQDGDGGPLEPGGVGSVRGVEAGGLIETGRLIEGLAPVDQEEDGPDEFA